MNLRNAIPYLFVLIAGGLAALAVYGSHGYLHVRELRTELRALENKNLSFESEISGLEEEIKKLRFHSFATEKLAREELGMSRPGEIVYIFPNSRSKPTQK